MPMKSVYFGNKCLTSRSKAFSLRKVLIVTERPTVWHCSLMAERWANHLEDAPEAPYFQQAVARFGEPVLDIACGAGRVLLPLLRAGIDNGGDLIRLPTSPTAHAP